MTVSHPEEVLDDAVCLRGDLAPGDERVAAVGFETRAEGRQARRMLHGRHGRVGHVLVEAVPVAVQGGPNGFYTGNGSILLGRAATCSEGFVNCFLRVPQDFGLYRAPE